MKEANEKYNLRLNRRYFEEAGAADPAERQLIELLNQKVAEDKDFKVPEGFKKVQDFIITNGFVADPRLEESERVSREILDQLLADQFGIRTIRPGPVKKYVTKVVVDANAPFRSPRNRSLVQRGGRTSQSAIRSNQSVSSADVLSQPNLNESNAAASPKRKKPPIFLSPNHRTYKK